jgi:hypothetical protein
MVERLFSYRYVPQILTGVMVGLGFVIAYA